MQPLRATEIRELALMVKLRDVPGLDHDIASDEDLLPRVTARQFFAAIDRFGTPRIAVNNPANDLPGPDAAALNALAMRLLGGAIAAGPQGAPGPFAPALTLTQGTVAPDDIPECALVRASSGEIEVTWAPASPGVAIQVIQQGVDLPDPQVQMLMGLYEPADAPAPSPVLEAIRNGATIWLPALPESLHWTLKVKVTDAAHVRICGRQ
jgi:hypothetical protein